MTGSMVPIVYEVVTVDRETSDTVTIVLRPVEEQLPRPRAGQFDMLWVPGVGEVPISLAGVRGDDLVHTIRSVGAVTDALCGLRPTDQIGVRGPFGTSWGLERAHGRDVLIVAGGLGLVPLRPVIEQLVRDRDSFNNVAVLVGARNAEGLIYREQLARWAETIDVRVTVDMATPEWQGRVGVVTGLLESTPLSSDDPMAFVCGPEIMMRVVASAIVERGVNPADIFVSLERNMHCGVGHCGRCQLGSVFLCRSGPVVSWNQANPLLAVRGR